MPNHVTTKLTIEGAPDEIEKFVKAHIVGDETEKRTLDFETVLAMPETLAGTTAFNRNTDEAVDATEATGFENWYDWRCVKWGTKWNSYHFSDEPYLPGDRSYTCSFDTAWSFPEPVFEQLAAQYPSLSMVVMFFDEGHNFAGFGKAEDPIYCEPTDELYEEVYGVAPEHEPEPNHDAEFDMEPEME